MSDVRPARSEFRVQTRRRGAYDGGEMIDVQLQVSATGALAWSQSFSDEAQAEEFERQVADDLGELGINEFRRKYGVPATT